MTEATTPKTKNKHKAPAPSPAYLRIGKRYRPNRLENNYDAVIVGSGPGGLSAAVCLSKMGWKVCVLEQHYTAGGFTHAYGRHGYEWDVGVHYIGDMGRKSAMGRQMFDFLSDNKLEWADMGEIYDTVFLGDDQFEFPKGYKALYAKLCERFPEEADGIKQYFELMRRISKAVPLFTLNKILPNYLSAPIHWWQKKSLPKEMFMLTQDVLDTFTSNKTLQAILTTQWGDSGLPPSRSSFLIHTLIVRHYLNGGYYPIGGASKIAETMLPAIQKNGGEVFTYAKVEEILVANNKVTGVKMADGHVINANIVISAAGVDLTLNKLLPAAISEQLASKKQQENIQASMAHFNVYIGLNKSSAELKLPKTNFWIYLDENHDANVDAFLDDSEKGIPLVYVSFPSAKDPSWDERYPNKATIEIVAAAKYQWFKAWESETWGQRGEEYEAIKQRWQDRLVDRLEEKMPGIKQHIDYCELSTPLSTQYFCEYQQGEIYGLDHTPSRFKQKWLKPKTPIKGLFLTGQDIMTAGVVGAAMTGFITALSILGIRKGLKLKSMIGK